MNIVRFTVALVVTVIVCVAGALLLEPSAEPDAVPHATHRDGAARGPGAGAASGPPQRPGSSLEGLELVTTRIATYVAAEQQRGARAAAELLAALPAVEVEPAPAETTPSAAPSTAGSSVNWDAVAQCETGGDWSMTGSSYSGGVGFANTSWNAYGGQEFADLAGHATREQQIFVAERIYADNGYRLSGAWGCDEQAIG